MKKAAIYTDGLTIPTCLFHPASETEVFHAVADKKSWWSRSDDQTPIEVEHGHVVEW